MKSFHEGQINNYICILFFNTLRQWIGQRQLQDEARNI